MYACEKTRLEFVFHSLFFILYKHVIRTNECRLSAWMPLRKDCPKCVQLSEFDWSSYLTNLYDGRIFTLSNGLFRTALNTFAFRCGCTTRSINLFFFEHGTYYTLTKSCLRNKLKPTSYLASKNYAKAHTLAWFSPFSCRESKYTKPLGIGTLGIAQCLHFTPHHCAQYTFK